MFMMDMLRAGRTLQAAQGEWKTDYCKHLLPFMMLMRTTVELRDYVIACLFHAIRVLEYIPNHVSMTVHPSSGANSCEAQIQQHSNDTIEEPIRKRRRK